MLSHERRHSPLVRGVETERHEILPQVESSLTDDGDEIRPRLEPALEWASAVE